MPRNAIRTAYRLGRELGFDPRRWRLLARLPRFLRDARHWNLAGGSIGSYFPCLADADDAAGAIGSPYFLQDLLVARRIFDAAPELHVDVGSRIDGFVAHLAVFRKVIVLDVRPLNSTIPNVVAEQCDLMAGVRDELRESADSVSSLHALEHFGLGRYGDPIDPDGHRKGFHSLTTILRPGGRLYVSFPIGTATVEFNAHRILDPLEPLKWPGSGALELEGFDYIDAAGALHERATLDPETVTSIRRAAPSCGIYTFRRAV